MQKFKKILKWKFIIPIFIIIIISISLIIIFQPIKTSKLVNHSLNPEKLSSVHPAELYCEGLLIYNDIIIISELGVSFVNISDPLNPTIINRFFDGGGAHTIRLKDNLLFVADHHQGMEILNINNLTNIIKIANVPVSEDTASIDLSNDLAFISAYEGLYIYNISNPYSPQNVGSYYSSKPFGYLEILNNYALISTPNGIDVLDISNPVNPVKTGEIGSWGQIRHFQIIGNILYGANMDRGVEIYDISNLQKPKLLGRFHDGGEPAYIHVIDDIAFVADYEDGLEIIDISNIRKMIEIGQFHEEGDYIRAVRVVDNLAYIFDASSDGLEIIQLWE